MYLILALILIVECIIVIGCAIWSTLAPADFLNEYLTKGMKLQESPVLTVAIVALGIALLVTGFIYWCIPTVILSLVDSVCIGWIASRYICMRLDRSDNNRAQITRALEIIDNILSTM